MKIKDETGKKGLPIKTIFRESIGFFKRHALEALCKDNDVRLDDIFWVLTVPAIWSEPAKQLMRVAAIEVNKGLLKCHLLLNSFLSSKSLVVLHVPSNTCGNLKPIVRN